MKHFLYRPACVRNHAHARRDQHVFKGSGNRSADKRVHPKLGHAPHAEHGLSILDARLLSADLGLALDIQKHQAPGDIEYRGNPAAPCRNSDFHHLIRYTLRAE